MMKTILIVEDDENLVRFIRVNLGAQGHAVLTAAAGRQGLDMAVANRPNLIILDLMLPQMGGWELLARLKSHPELYRIPILILTATADPEEAARAHRMGAADYLVKPISASELMRHVRRILHESPLPPRTEAPPG